MGVEVAADYGVSFEGVVEEVDWTSSFVGYLLGRNNVV